MVSSRLLAHDQKRLSLDQPAAVRPNQTRQCQGNTRQRLHTQLFRKEASGFEEKGLHISSSLKIHMFIDRLPALRVVLELLAWLKAVIVARAALLGQHPLEYAIDHAQADQRNRVTSHSGTMRIAATVLGKPLPMG